MRGRKNKRRSLRAANLEPLTETAKRLLRYVCEDPVTGCWNWTGAINDKKSKLRYGRVWFHGRMEYAHRVSYFVFVGDVEAKLEIMHLCDNEPCINPKHLKQGTHKANINYKYSDKYYGPGQPIARQVSLRFPELISEVPF